jgi:hypothetical protein
MQYSATAVNRRQRLDGSWLVGQGWQWVFGKMKKKLT